MFRQDMRQQIRHQAVVPAAAVVGREADVDPQPLEVFNAGEILRGSSAIAERYVQSPRDVARRIAIAPFVQRFLSQGQKRRLPDAAGDEDQVVGGYGWRLRP